MTHPIIEATGAIAAALKAVADCNPTFMSTDDKAAALRELSRAEARLAELRLRVLSDAGDVAATTGAHDVAEWVTVHLHARHEEARAELRLAHALDRRYAATARGLRDGEIGVAQAQVIVTCLDRLPAEVSGDLLALAETTLLGHAAHFGPRQLARLGRRILDVVAPEVADAVEARRLAALEADAQRRTLLWLRRVGDGTTRLSGLLPDAAATRLATYLDAFTNARRDPGDHAHDTVGTADPLARLPYPRRLGQAFCQLLEAVAPTRLPLHGGDATTVVVTIPLASLVAELGTADLIGGQLAGDDLPGTTITAAQARRLACTAQLIPAVLGGESELLDLGRSRRLFSPRSVRRCVCATVAAAPKVARSPAPGARPTTGSPGWPGGPTDLDNGLLLCHHHHQRVHDTAYRPERLANGDVRFHRRR